MKILVCNKFYFPKGGDCVYSIELEKLLKKNGHETAFFAMNHPQNHFSTYSQYYPSTVDYSTKNLANLQEQLLRPIFSVEVKKKFNALLEAFKPDIVHVNNIHSQLSPIIVKEAYKKGIPVVWTLHDYKLICSRYDSMRNEKPCELCYQDKTNVIRHKCLKGSLAASMLAYTEATWWSSDRLEKYTSKFISPSTFLKEKMVTGGFNPSKIITLPNFIDEKKIADQPEVKEDYYCFVGRLSKEKGIDTLCEAACKIPSHKLLIIGTGPEEKFLKEKYSCPNIQFLGHKGWIELQPIIAKAKCLVIASKWYENNPLSVIEALANGTPVIGAKIGGIPELIQDGVNGLLFEPGNSDDLKNKIDLFFDSFYSKIDNTSLIEQIKKNHSSEKYYFKLITLYESLLSTPSLITA
ncbi:glycosyltransferase [Pontibacter locisalis]|uniref:Glycosyltransferase n=1 Tax=Pontibacter locisalis TaxID=1719035 RepID=A0ABW5IMI7_9BACT